VISADELEDGEKVFLKKKVWTETCLMDHDPMGGGEDWFDTVFFA